MSNCVEIELVPSEDQEPLLDTSEEDWDVVHLMPRHTIFLSHSGVQKNFVEQLCEDLERAKQAPFFDKRPDSLPKGEVFAQLIFQAARQCKVAIVVVSEEYFSRSKWPMLELAAFVQARKSGKCKILPLFFGLSIKEFKNEKRRQRWFERWEAWAQLDPRIQVDVWKDALSELDQRNGEEYVKALGEVFYRKKVVEIICTRLEKSLQDEVLACAPKDSDLESGLPPVEPSHKGSIVAWKLFCLRGVLIILKVLGGIVAYICVIVIFAFLFFRVIVPIIEKYVLHIDSNNWPGPKF